MATALYSPAHQPYVKRYELIDHTADLMVKAYGDTLEECFANAGYALFDQTVDLSGISPSDTFRIETGGDDLEDRLYSFLSELLFLEDCEGVVLCDITVAFHGDKVICTGKGEVLDRSRHRIKSEIKAVTFHMMSVDVDEPSVTVIFDV
ncbi:MAG: archease [Candidatus Methanoplasma sp.]|jgi:SHS2 domain-containing protein|nr:archease [Candidatus Methanoplasma sp.]